MHLRRAVQSACAAIEDVSSETEVFLERNPVKFTTMNGLTLPITVTVRYNMHKEKQIMY